MPRRGNTAYDESDKSEISDVEEADATDSVDETGMAADSNLPETRGEERHGRLEENVEKQDEGGNAPDFIQEDVAEGNAPEQVELVDVIADVPETRGEGRHGRIEEDVEKQDEGGNAPILFKRMSQREVNRTEDHVDVTAGVEEDVVRMDSGPGLEDEASHSSESPANDESSDFGKETRLGFPHSSPPPSPTPSVRSEESSAERQRDEDSLRGDQTFVGSNGAGRMESSDSSDVPHAPGTASGLDSLESCRSDRSIDTGSASLTKLC